jgi:transposase InsO family protein
VNHKRVLRMMREDNLLCVRQRAFTVTTDSRHNLPVYPNLGVIEKTSRRMAGTTGLEPATSDVTGRRSNQLNYVPALCGRSQCNTHLTLDHGTRKNT